MRSREAEWPCSSKSRLGVYTIRTVWLKLGRASDWFNALRAGIFKKRRIERAPFATFTAAKKAV